MKANKREITIGICVIIALAVLFFGIDYLKGVNLLHPTNYYFAQYENVAGLQTSAPVTLNGFKVGQVREINYEYDNPGHVRVELSLDKALRVPVGTKAVIEQDLLGTASVVLHFAATSNFHDVGNELIGETASGMLESVSTQLMPSLGAILPKVDSLLTTLNALAANPALQKSLTRLDDITLNIDRTMRSINRTTAQLPAVMVNVDSTTTNLAALTGELATFSGTLNQLPIDSTMANVEALSANLKALSQELNNPNSTIGALLHDRALYNSLNGAAGSLDSLLQDVKAHPKRYISIKLF